MGILEIYLKKSSSLHLVKNYTKLSERGWFSKKNVWNDRLFSFRIAGNLDIYENDDSGELMSFAIILLKSGVILKPEEIIFYNFNNITVKLNKNDILLLNTVDNPEIIPFTDNISDEDKDFVINHIKTVNDFQTRRYSLSEIETSSIKNKNGHKTFKGISKKEMDNSTRIIVDGSNLCYKNGKNFIGLAALKKITNTLAQTYSNIVVFDSQILNLLTTFERTRITQKDLEGILGNNCEVHIVQSKRKADDTIISYIRNDKEAFVLSNDKFKNYMKETNEFEDRLIGFEILGNQAIIHDLDVNVSY
jgi:rRNA-processing protein FCF1